MTGFLIDTNVLSEYNRPEGPDPGVKRWLERTDRQSHYVSVITLAEIRKGIELLAEGRRRTQLEQWLATLRDGSPDASFPWIARSP
jgi:toxin FitB